MKKNEGARTAVSALLAVTMVTGGVPAQAIAAGLDAVGTEPIIQTQSAESDDAAEGADASDGTTGEDATTTDGSNDTAKQKLVMVNGTDGYDSLEDAFKKATPDANGVITYEIYGKAEIQDTRAAQQWIQILPAGSSASSVKFVGKTSDAEISILGGPAVLADNNSGNSVDVSLKDLKLSKPNSVSSAVAGDLSDSTYGFSVLLRANNQANHRVTYDHCTFPNGAHNNWYGKTIFTDCTFNSASNGESKYTMWVGPHGTVGNVTGSVEASNCTFDGACGIKIYSVYNVPDKILKLSNSTVKNVKSGYSAISVSVPATVELENVNVENCPSGIIGNRSSAMMSATTKSIPGNGSAISGTFELAAKSSTIDEAKGITGGNFTADVSDYLAPGVTMSQGEDGTYTAAPASKGVAEVDGKSYETLQAAIDNADEVTVKLTADVTEDIVIPKGKTITLDLAGHTLTNVNDHTIINNGSLTVTDSSDSKNGTVDNVTPDKAALINHGSATLERGTFERSAEAGKDPKDNGGNSYYTILNGDRNIETGASMTIVEGVSVKNSGKFSSNINNGVKAVLAITGGSFEGGVNTVKNEEGTLTINGGSFTNAYQYSIMNWGTATIEGGAFETAKTGTAVLFSSSYKDSKDSLEVKGGTFSGNVPMIRNYWDNANKSDHIAVSGGTFSSEVDNIYCAAGYAPVKNADGTFGVGIDTSSETVSGVDISQYRDGDTYTAPQSSESGKAFAGWYSDASFKTAITSNVKSGNAYPKFVNITDLIKFKGGSLRMDFTGEDGKPDYSQTSLRFGYETYLPTGAKLDASKWGWTVYNPANDGTFEFTVKNYWLIDNNGAIANLVITPLYISEQTNYNTNVQVTEHVAYTTADGTYVEVRESQPSVRSVKTVADAILSNSFASATEREYAQGIIDALKSTNS